MEPNDCCSPPPRGELFNNPAARVVWPAVLALPEGVKHELLRALSDHLAFSGDRSTPTAQRVARAVQALREAYELFARDGFGPLGVETYRALR